MGGRLFREHVGLSRAVLAGLAAFMLLAMGLVPGAVGKGSAATPVPSTEVRFTDDSINRTAPQGLVQDIDLYLGGGSYPGCMRVPEVPSLNYMPGDLELMDIAMVSTCGWQPDEMVKVTLREPTGKLQTFSVKAIPAKHYSAVYQADIYFQPSIDAPAGMYRWTFEGSQGVVRAKVQFDKPDGARIFALSDDPFKPAFGAVGTQHRLMLAGFLPEEPVRLMAYRFRGTHIQFYGLQDYTTDRTGRLIVQVDLPKVGVDLVGDPSVQLLTYTAYGRETHFVAMERFNAAGFSSSDPFVMDLYCPGAQTPRVKSPGAVRAVPPAGTNMKIVQVPGFGSRVTVEVPARTELRVFGQPKCIDHAFWWQVSVREPARFGWAAETALGKYLIEPIQP